MAEPAHPTDADRDRWLIEKILPVGVACMIFGAAAAAGARDWRSFAVFAVGVVFFGWPYGVRLLRACTSRAHPHR
ncbi:hypothetical protein [Sphingomonas sp. 3-13AW]|uniref:hypothetical protein n=1 Tax=Sphingomonas sp. 3-13AW TaxID=3050450 RepID=UPI003BB7C131